MQDKHTPGPWTVAIQEHTSGLARGLQSGWVHGPAGHIEVAVPDARLIAAAPSMLATLQQIERLSREADGSLVNVTAMLGDIARAAIAKATGSAL
jgi:hypothetical protein